MSVDAAARAVRGTIKGLSVSEGRREDDGLSRRVVAQPRAARSVPRSCHSIVDGLRMGWICLDKWEGKRGEGSELELSIFDEAVRESVERVD